MAEELMTVAICWQLNQRMPVEFAYANREIQDLYYFCPDLACLCRVHSRRRKNTFFVAEAGGHADQCEYKKNTPVANPAPGTPQVRDMASAPQHYPTLLGLPPLATNHGIPEFAARHTLARAIANQPVLFPAKLKDVVAAFHGMSLDERRKQPLRVDAQDATYYDHFRLVARPKGQAIALTEALHPHNIRFGGASVRANTTTIFIKTWQRFTHDGTTLPISFHIAKRQANPELEALIGTDVTAYWHNLPGDFVQHEYNFSIPLMSEDFRGVVIQANLSQA